MRLVAFLQAVLNSQDSDVDLTRQYPPMTTTVRQYSQWRPASLKIILVDRVDWRLGKRI